MLSPYVLIEPLYQYINTAEFLRTPQENVKTGLTKNQLEIARQLSSRRLWCEQPEVCVIPTLCTHALCISYNYVIIIHCSYIVSTLVYTCVIM